MKCPQCGKGMQPLTIKFEDKSEYSWFCETCHMYHYSEIHKTSPFRNISEEQRRRWLKEEF